MTIVNQNSRGKFLNKQIRLLSRRSDLPIRGIDFTPMSVLNQIKMNSEREESWLAVKKCILEDANSLDAKSLCLYQICYLFCRMRPCC